MVPTRAPSPRRIGTQPPEMAYTFGSSQSKPPGRDSLRNRTARLLAPNRRVVSILRAIQSSLSEVEPGRPA